MSNAHVRIRIVMHIPIFSRELNNRASYHACNNAIGEGCVGGGGRRGSRPLVGEDKRGLGIAVVERSVAISQVQALAVCNWQTDLKRILKWIPTEIGDKLCC